MFGECHAHFFMNGFNYKEAAAAHRNQVQDQVIRTWFQAYKDRGIGFIRDGGDAFGVSARARELSAEYGIDYRTPGFAIHKNHHYGGIVGLGFDTIGEYQALVCRAREQKADFIKIMVSGIMDFRKAGALTCTSLSEYEICEMIHIAHEEGMAVMVHANGSMAVRAAVLAGADSIEHGNYMDQDCLQAMAEFPVVWVPTLATIHNLTGSGRFPHEQVSIIYHKASERVQEAYGMGVQMALGSDAGAYLVAHGQGISDEYHCFRNILGAGEGLDAYLARGESCIRSKFCR